MVEVVAADSKKTTVFPELFKHPKAALESFEAEAKGRIKSFTTTGNARLAELDDMLKRVASEDWSFSGLRRRAEALGGRARSARKSAVKRLDALPGVAVVALASAGRTRVQGISRRLQWVAARLDAPAARPNGQSANGVTPPAQG